VSFIGWLIAGWAWLMFVSLLVGGFVAFTVEYFFVSPSSPLWAGYLVSGLSAFAATLAALFSTGRTKRLWLGVLTAALLLGTADVVTALLTRFGVDVPRVGFLTLLAGTSVGVGAQLVNGVALLAASAVFVFVRQFDAAEKRQAELATVEGAEPNTTAESDQTHESEDPG
jgi:signal transduction histidine kinase